jgi:YcaO-like protein with predicted kinase domain
MPFGIEGGGSGLAERTPKVVRAGTHRAETLESTVERLKRLAPVMGITRVANVTGLDAIGIPVVMVCRPNSRSVAVSQGKGVDLMSARASGLMEAAELYHAETITLPLRLATYEELRYKHNVVDPEMLARTSDSGFHPYLRLLWAEGRDLFSENAVLLPYETVHTDFTIPQPNGHGHFNASSNGLASGNHLLEAITHGLCEIVERDATALWKLLGQDRFKRGRLELASVDDPTCQSLLEKFFDAKVSVAVWDVTADIRLPVFACFVLPEQESGLEHAPTVAGGFGCHPARAVALARALTEAAQSRLTLISGSRDDFGSEAYDPDLDDPLLDAIRSRTAPCAGRRFRDISNWDGETLESDLEWELARIKEAGLEQVVVVNLSKEEFGISVVRVVIPGLEPMIFAGYVPGPRGRAVLEASE